MPVIDTQPELPASGGNLLRQRAQIEDLEILVEVLEEDGPDVPDTRRELQDLRQRHAAEYARLESLAEPKSEQAPPTRS